MLESWTNKPRCNFKGHRRIAAHGGAWHGNGGGGDHKWQLLSTFGSHKATNKPRLGHLLKKGQFLQRLLEETFMTFVGGSQMVDKWDVSMMRRQENSGLLQFIALFINMPAHKSYKNYHKFSPLCQSCLQHSISTAEILPFRCQGPFFGPLS